MNQLGYWQRLLRLYSLPASFVPALLGSAYAYIKTGALNGWVFTAMLCASALVHIATNLFNDYYDYKSGLDTKESVSLGGGIVHDGASPQFIFRLALVLDAAAIILGLYLCTVSSWTLAVVGGLFLLVGYLYTGGPLPIATTPFGEVVSGLCMGGGITCIAYYVQTGVLAVECVLVSVPTALLIGLIMACNNIRDRERDGQNGRRTSAVLLGHKHAVWVASIVYAAVFLWPIFLIYHYSWPPVLLLPVLTFPLAIKTMRIIWAPNQTVQAMMPAVQTAAQIDLLYGLLFIAGLLLKD